MFKTQFFVEPTITRAVVLLGFAHHHHHHHHHRSADNGVIIPAEVLSRIVLDFITHRFCRTCERLALDYDEYGIHARTQVMASSVAPQFGCFAKSYVQDGYVPTWVVTLMCSNCGKALDAPNERYDFTFNDFSVCPDYANNLVVDMEGCDRERPKPSAQLRAASMITLRNYNVAELGYRAPHVDELIGLYEQNEPLRALSIHAVASTTTTTQAVFRQSDITTWPSTLGEVVLRGAVVPEVEHGCVILPPSIVSFFVEHERVAMRLVPTVMRAHHLKELVISGWMENRVRMQISIEEFDQLWRALSGHPSLERLTYNSVLPGGLTTSQAVITCAASMPRLKRLQIAVSPMDALLADEGDIVNMKNILSDGGDTVNAQAAEGSVFALNNDDDDGDSLIGGSDGENNSVTTAVVDVSFFRAHRCLEHCSFIGLPLPEDTFEVFQTIPHLSSFECAFPDECISSMRLAHFQPSSSPYFTSQHFHRSLTSLHLEQVCFADDDEVDLDLEMCLPNLVLLRVLWCGPINIRFVSSTLHTLQLLAFDLLGLCEQISSDRSKLRLPNLELVALDQCEGAVSFLNLLVPSSPLIENLTLVGDELTMDVATRIGAHLTKLTQLRLEMVGVVTFEMLSKLECPWLQRLHIDTSLEGSPSFSLQWPHLECLTLLTSEIETWQPFYSCTKLRTLTVSRLPADIQNELATSSDGSLCQQPVGLWPNLTVLKFQLELGHDASKTDLEAVHSPRFMPHMTVQSCFFDEETMMYVVCLKLKKK
eukprot:PhM_4_TR5044/c0_g1_i1/m.76543